MIATSTLVTQHGPDGKKAIKEWLRYWGDRRGKELRKAHMALGLLINMDSLCKHYQPSIGGNIEKCRCKSDLVCEIHFTKETV